MFHLYLILLVAAAAAYFVIRSMWNRILRMRYALESLDREKKTICDFLDRIGGRVTEGADPAATMELIVDFAQEATRADGAALFITDRDGQSLRPQVVRGMFPPLHSHTSEKLLSKRKFVEEIVKKEVVPMGEGVVGMCAKSGKPLMIADAAKDERVPKCPLPGIELVDLLLAPMVVRGETLGVLALVNKREDGPFNVVDQSLVSAIADQAAVTLELVRLYEVMAEKQRIEQELSVARTFQLMLLPRQTPQYPGLNIAGFYRPALEVGGDYFDYIEIDGRHLGIAIGDVSGKGIPGALVMASVRATLQAEARITLSPKAVLRAVNERIVRDTKDGVFITMTYGVLDTLTGRFRFCRSGHEPIICCHDGGRGITTYSPEGIALGIVSGALFDITEEQEIGLAEDQTIVLYTDGVIEAMNARAEEYGEKRLHGILDRNQGAAPQSVIDDVVHDIERFTSGLPQHDDITIVVLSWAGDTAGAMPQEQREATTA